MQTKPLARSEGLLLERIDDEQVAYDLESKEAHCLSALAAAVFDSCDGQTSVEKIATVASARLGETVEQEQVLDTLAQLEERNLLDTAGRRGGLSRRQLIQRGAVAAASVPVITSILAPSPAAASTPTCGTILCCPCGTGAVGQPCCEHGTAFQCNCTAAESGASCKQCKPSGPAGGAGTTPTCQGFFPGTGFPPGVSQTANGPCPCNLSACTTA